VGGLTPAHPDYAHPWDHHKYVYMAEHGVGRFHIAPFCWRIGVPMAAGMLPFDIAWNFRTVTALSLWVAALAMYWLARASGKPPATAMFAMLTLLGVGWATKYLLFDFWLPDAAALAIVTLAVGCILTGRDWQFAVLLALGALIKESTIFVAPLYWTLPRAETGRGGRLMRGIAVALPAVTILIGLRFAIPARNHDPDYVKALPRELSQVDQGRTSYQYTEQIQRVSWSRVRDVSARWAEAVHSYSVGALGVLPLVLPFFAGRRNARLLVRLSPFLLLVYGQLLFATDTQRLLALALPAVLLMTMNGLEGLSQRCRTAAAMFLPLPILLIAMNLWQADRMAGPSWMETCIVAVYLAAVWLWGRRGGGDASEPRFTAQRNA
jgi:hypothetical protein